MINKKKHLKKFQIAVKSSKINLSEFFYRSIFIWMCSMQTFEFCLRKFNINIVLIFFFSSSKLFSPVNCYFFLSDFQEFLGIIFVGLGETPIWIAASLFVEKLTGDFAAPSAITMDAAWMAALQNLLPPALQRVFLAQRCRESLGNYTCLLFAIGTHFYSVQFDTIF